jgi:hypothetical protein
MSIFWRKKLFLDILVHLLYLSPPSMTLAMVSKTWSMVESLEPRLPRPSTNIINNSNRISTSLFKSLMRWTDTSLYRFITVMEGVSRILLITES